jgi:glutaredoxin 3
MIQIYSTETCVFCRKAKEYLKNRKLEYTEYNVGEDMMKAQEMMAKSGQMGVPVLDIAGDVIVGFDVIAIEESLKKHHLLPR